MNKKIITIAEIVFALIFVVLLAVFMATINSKGNAANNQLVDVMDANSASSIEAYEGKGIMKGTMVSQAMENIASIGGEVNDFRISVFTNEGGENTYNKDKKYNVNNSKNRDYINPNGDFYCYVVYNENDIPVGMCFVQSKYNGGSGSPENPKDWTEGDLTFPPVD